MQNTISHAEEDGHTANIRKFKDNYTERIAKAKTLQTLKLVECNHSFSSVEEDKCFKMFPDLKIAEKDQ